ncbi:MAG: hypothetical protein M1837_003503 [Sclerophora amabilis]|nr:MAG: hypothetical protein M1837_003503 [Sclerophora amabilis]
MPLGIERINARRRQPNERIVFIKPREGPDKELALDFLERIAAICSPVMRSNHLAVMSLEEYEPNLEFVGRNFNAGEVIQLVLKAPFTGHWLPFRHVQMVMMHELAHCKQMNHSGAFWKVRNQYAGELRDLWAKSYTGDGFWSRGQTVLSGQYTTSSLPATETLPRLLCGGTYRSSRHAKRKRKPKAASSNLTYAEKRQRRIQRRFGIQGQALGEDQSSRVKLENGKMSKAKPRVAGSARGRELRAAAALARFDQDKKQNATEEEALFGSSETESDYEDGDLKEDALDLRGNRLVDEHGHDMVKVCGGEDMNEDVDAQREAAELQEVEKEDHGPGLPKFKSEHKPHSNSSSVRVSAQSSRTNVLGMCSEKASGSQTQADEKKLGGDRTSATKGSYSSKVLPGDRHPLDSQSASPVHAQRCSVCSMENEPESITCAACSNVLEPERHAGSWRCQSGACKGGFYNNAGDCGLCGVCGSRKALTQA